MGNYLLILSAYSIPRRVKKISEESKSKATPVKLRFLSANRPSSLVLSELFQRNQENSVFCRQCVPRIAGPPAREVTLYTNLEKLLQMIERVPLQRANGALPARSSQRVNSSIQHTGYTLNCAAASSSSAISHSTNRATSGSSLLQSNCSAVGDSHPLLDKAADPSFLEILATNKQIKQNHIDDEFLPVDKSIFDCHEGNANEYKKVFKEKFRGKIHWIRPAKICVPLNVMYKDCVLFRENPLASDIQQGQLGI